MDTNTSPNDNNQISQEPAVLPTESNQKSNKVVVAIIVTLLVLAAGAGGYYLGMNRSSASTALETTPSQVIDPPTSIPVQISPLPQDTVEVSGYYKTYEGKDWGDVTVTCESLVVTSGDEELIADFKTRINKGNTINELDEKGNLMMNIEMPTNATLTQKIKQSSESSQVTLAVKKKEEGGRGIGKCFSFVEIVDVR